MDSGVATDVHDIWVGTMLQQKSRTLLLLAFDGLLVLRQESTCNAGDRGDKGLILGLERFPGGENGNPLHYSCLKKILWREEPSGLQSNGL